jgi:hypothetical protein
LSSLQLQLEQLQGTCCVLADAFKHALCFTAMMAAIFKACVLLVDMAGAPVATGPDS